MWFAENIPRLFSAFRSSFAIFVFILLYVFVQMNTNKESTPLWFVAVLVVMALPLIGYPRLLQVAMLENVEGVNLDILSLLVYAMPVYVIASQVFSYKVYSQWSALAWVLQVLLFVTYAVSWWLVVQVG